MAILVTGASGFIGTNFLQYSEFKERVVTASVRSTSRLPHFKNIETVIHFGGKAGKASQKLLFESNSELTAALAKAAKTHGVTHFIYISSVKVYGNHVNSILHEESICKPDDYYGKSKYEAEKQIKQLSDASFVVSIVRPPLVYGAGVKGNMLSLINMANRNMYLPFKNIQNSRSIVFVKNLIALIDALLKAKEPGIFLASDRNSLSTPALIALLRKELKQKEKFISLPVCFLFLIKKRFPSLYHSLFASFVIDTTITNNCLRFQPPYSTEEGIAETVRWYQKNHHA